MAQPQQRPNLFHVVAAVALALMAASCHSGGERIRLDNSSNGHTISAAPGDEIEITLQTIGPGQYLMPTVAGPILSLGEFPAAVQNPGGPTQIFRFQAVTVGRGEVFIPHTASAPPSPQTPPFAIVVEVR
jgi:hypothetical protein